MLHRALCRVNYPWILVSTEKPEIDSPWILRIYYRCFLVFYYKLASKEAVEEAHIPSGQVSSPGVVSSESLGVMEKRQAKMSVLSFPSSGFKHVKLPILERLGCNPMHIYLTISPTELDGTFF